MVLGLDVVGKRLGLLELRVVVIVVSVVILRPGVLHLVDAAAFGASLDGAFTGDLVTVSISSLLSVYDLVKELTPSQVTT